MKNILICGVILCIFVNICDCSSIESLLPIHETPSPGGFWKTRTEWKAYWVKDWVVKKLYVPIWKRVWGPAQVKEWVPTGVAKPYPGGLQHHTTIH